VIGRFLSPEKGDRDSEIIWATDPGIPGLRVKKTLLIGRRISFQLVRSQPALTRCDDLEGHPPSRLRMGS
jgi:hypothetical protein